MSKQIIRPWGTEDLFVENKQVTVKLLYVRCGEAESLQYHNHREEFWKVINGSPEIIIGAETFNAQIGEEFSVPALVHHRISAPKDDVTILEISTGHFDEEDIVRLEDKYRRV